MRPHRPICLPVSVIQNVAAGHLRLFQFADRRQMLAEAYLGFDLRGHRGSRRIIGDRAESLSKDSRSARVFAQFRIQGRELD